MNAKKKIIYLTTFFSLFISTGVSAVGLDDGLTVKIICKNTKTNINCSLGESVYDLIRKAEINVKDVCCAFSVNKKKVLPFLFSLKFLGIENGDEILLTNSRQDNERCIAVPKALKGIFLQRCKIADTRISKINFSKIKKVNPLVKAGEMRPGCGGVNYTNATKPTPQTTIKPSEGIGCTSLPFPFPFSYNPYSYIIKCHRLKYTRDEKFYIILNDIFNVKKSTDYPLDYKDIYDNTLLYSLITERCTALKVVVKEFNVDLHTDTSLIKFAISKRAPLEAISFLIEHRGIGLTNCEKDYIEQLRDSDYKDLLKKTFESSYNKTEEKD